MVQLSELLVSLVLFIVVSSTTIKPLWDREQGTVLSTPSILVVPDSLFKRGSPSHNNMFQSLKDLKPTLTSFKTIYAFPYLGAGALTEPDGNPRCASITTGTVGHLVCSQGDITSIDVGYFGNPSGHCGAYQEGSCNIDPTTALNKMCLGKPMCSINVTSDIFGSSCGKDAVLSVQAKCSLWVNSTSWDFSSFDPVMDDFIEAQGGQDFMLDLAMIPRWMFNSPSPIPNPYDENEAWTWKLPSGELRDHSFTELSDYFYRIVSYFVKGEMTDEYGFIHKREKGPVPNLKYFQVLNEPNLWTSVEYYTKLYDAIVGRLSSEFPHLKFVGMEQSSMGTPENYEYFLNPKNHMDGVPYDWVSFHFYASPNSSTDAKEISLAFNKVDTSLVPKIEAISNQRSKYAPDVKLSLDEVGLSFGASISYDTFTDMNWQAANSFFTYAYFKTAHLVQSAQVSQLHGYPLLFPGSTMVKWDTGVPNAKYWGLKLLMQTSSVDDMLYITETNNNVTTFAQAIEKKDGSRLVVIVNKSPEKQTYVVEESSGKTFKYIDLSTVSSMDQTKSVVVQNNTFSLGQFGWGVLSLQ